MAERRHQFVSVFLMIMRERGGVREGEGCEIGMSADDCAVDVGFLEGYGGRVRDAVDLCTCMNLCANRNNSCSMSRSDHKSKLCFHIRQRKLPRSQSQMPEASMKTRKDESRSTLHVGSARK